MSTRRVDPSEDEGAILVLVLAFLAVFGIVVVGLLGQSDVSLRNTTAVSDFGAKVYSADSALDVGVEAVQTDPTLCPDAGTATTITDSLVVDDAVSPVVVTCRTTAGSAGGWRGYAVITTSTAADSLSTQSGGPVKEVAGAVFVNGGAQIQRPVEVQDANFVQSPHGAPCVGAGDVSAVPSPPHGRVCGNVPLPVLDAVAPAVPTAVNPLVDLLVAPGCAVFSPGRYTAPPVLHPVRNYFRSGVYYFDYPGTWTIDQTSVVGGTSGGTAALLDAPCLDETTPDGDGVTFVLRGTASIALTNQARVELHARRTSPPQPADGTPGISLFVQGGRPGPALEQRTGNPQVVLHGSLYSPDADVLTNATGDVSFVARNGIVASRLLLQSTGDGLELGTAGGASQRTVVVESLATQASGGRTVTGKAVVDIAPDRSVTVRSRRSD